MATFLLIGIGSEARAEETICVLRGTVSLIDESVVAGCAHTTTTLAEALQLSSELPDVDTGNGPARPEVLISLFEDAANPGEPFREALDIDTRGEGESAWLEVHFRGSSACPPDGLPAFEPVAELATDGYLFLSGLVIDLDGLCSAPSPHPGVELSGGGLMQLIDAEISGWQGYAIRDSGFGPTPELSFGSSTISHGEGVAVKLRGPWSSSGLIVAYNHLPPDLGEPALVQSTSAFNIQGSVFLGNRIDDVVGQDSALLRGRGRIHRSAFLGNVLAEQTNLLQLGFDEWPTFSAADPPAPESEHGLTELVIADNVFTTSPDDWEAPSVVVPRLAGARGACWSTPTDGLLSDLPLPSVSSDGEGELLRIDTDFGQTQDGTLLMARSFIVDNASTGGPVFSVRAPGANLSIQLVGNTFGNNGSDSLVFFPLGETSGLELSIARNLAVQPSWGESTVVWDGPVQSFLETFNHGDPPLDWSDTPTSNERSLFGPRFAGTPVEFRPQADVLALDPCEQMQLLCPDASPDDCTAQEGDPPFHCPVSAAASYLPTHAWTSANAHPWPWGAGYFSGDSNSSAAGATGWACSAAVFSHDLVPDSQTDGTIGDGDGFPTLFDCDNEDPDVFPELPEHDGYTSEYCIEPDGRCYVCPEGPNPPPEGDDDDSAALDDDDSGDDDDSAEQADDDDAVFVDPEEPGCSVQGCSVSWTCEDGGVAGVALLMVGVRRRRRTSARVALTPPL